MSRREIRGTQALESWARQVTDGYKGVTVKNMTTSWRDGLAFCALIHSHYPDLIDYDTLDAKDVHGNCNLAFEVAERELGIPQLLDANDMVAHSVPDRLSILTYVAQFHSTFKKAVPPRSPRPVTLRDKEPLKNGDNQGDKSQKEIPPKMKPDEEDPPSEPSRALEDNSQIDLEPSDILITTPVKNLFTLQKVKDSSISPSTLMQEDQVKNRMSSTNSPETERKRDQETETTSSISKPDEAQTCVTNQTKTDTDTVTIIVEPTDELSPSRPDSPSRKAKVHFLAQMVQPSEEDVKPKVPPSHKVASPSPILRKKKDRAPLPKTPPPSTTSSSLPSSPKPQPKPKPRTRFLDKPESLSSVITNSTELQVASAEVIWKSDNYYPADLNPFESEEDLVGSNPFEEENPEDQSALPEVGTTTTTTETVVPKAYNPFEDEEDDGVEVGDSLSSFNLSVSAPSPFNSSMSSLSSFGPDGSTKHNKKRRAPLPPAFMPTLSSTPSIPLISKVKTESGCSVEKSGSRYRKTRRAPPPKRPVAPIPESKIKLDLEDLEVQRGELERQGVELEQNIRNYEMGNEYREEDAVEEMMLQLFSIVGEKNDIVRRQAELEYLTRGHRLEKQQAQIEFDLRVLMETPDAQKKPEDSTKEKELLNELLRVVDERNEVVDWLDFHRQMDKEQEALVSRSLTSFTLSSKSPSPDLPAPPSLTVPEIPIPSDTSSTLTKAKKATSKTSASDKSKDKRCLPDVVEPQSTTEKKKGKLKFFSLRRKSKGTKVKEET